jgi:peptidoglycan/xylan/chitin deacetylase (PgdA/CDA1 family)
MKPPKLLVVPLIFLVACGSTTTIQPTATSTLIPPTATDTIPPTSTSTSTVTPTPTSSPTPTLIWQAAGNVTCPILLYHHVVDTSSPQMYYISTSDFEAEMNLLSNLGYTTIPISLLVQAITKGADLPARPVVITFDDGNEDIYTNAFPIMQRLGMQGVLYIVSNRLGAQDYLGIPEILKMVSAGWEVGDHSRTHINLKDNPTQLWDEAVQSRMDLQAALGQPIDTFAYPFGAVSENTMAKISRYGYKAAVGLGTSPIQGPFNLFYLNRIVLDSSIDLQRFTGFLPWTEPIH